ncbi:cell division inhibitor SulA [Marinobacter sp. X15-166B]|uniref:cell division inhibitor SulA n=1 Tax=Marinobacter sp. X15-166B TaxID=1897620 RepID=UPI00085C1E60|nr:SulA-like leucine-rich domain-containing protein [Marinobacter sp. X15-166B]OEY67057.1 LexA family transcriptional regulator [Marinobacter sp. X15-166B]
MEQLSFNQGPSFNHDQLFSVAALARAGGRGRRTGALTVPQAQPDAAPAVEGNVTEIIVPEGQVENFQLLLPMLTQLNREHRWLAWIDPPQRLVARWQTMHGIVANQLLVLRSTAGYSAQQLAERALRAGTCHAVVMWTGKLSRSALVTLQQASASGNSHGVVLRQRPAQCRV